MPESASKFPLSFPVISRFVDRCSCFSAACHGAVPGGGVIGALVDMFWDQIGMGTEAVAGAFDLDDDCMMEIGRAARWRRPDRRTRLPFGEASLWSGSWHLFVACVDQLEEEVGATVGDRKIADLIDDQGEALL